MNKKGAVEMLETIMVLVVVILLIIIATVFFFRANARSMEDIGKEICQLSGEDLLLAITGMPEIQHSINTESKKAIDMKKVSAFQALLKRKAVKEKYRNYFSSPCPKTVKIDLLYPKPENDEECTQNAEIGSCKTWTIFKAVTNSKSKQLISTPISIHSDGKNYVGRLTVEIYT